MRDDQRKRLGDLSERLAEQAIGDADPSNWDGDGQTPVDMDRDTRGNAVWCRKLALQTLAVLASVERLREAKPPSPDEPGEPNVNEDIDRAEREAKRLLERIGKRGKRERSKP